IGKYGRGSIGFQSWPHAHTSSRYSRTTLFESGNSEVASVKNAAGRSHVYLGGWASSAPKYTTATAARTHRNQRGPGPRAIGGGGSGFCTEGTLRRMWPDRHEMYQDPASRRPMATRSAT